MTEALQLEIRTLRALLDSERDPGGRVFAPLADAYRRAGQIPEALRLLRDGIAKHPEFVTGHVVAAQLYVEQGLAAEGAIAARRALQLDGENVNALKALLRALGETGAAEEAEGVRSLLTTLEPDFSPDWEARVVERSDGAATTEEEDRASLAPTMEIRSVGPEISAELSLEPQDLDSEADAPPTSAAMIDLTTIGPLPFADVTPSPLAPDLPSPGSGDTELDLDLGLAGLDLPGDDEQGDAPTLESTLEEPVLDVGSFAPEAADEELVIDLPTLALDAPDDEPVMDLPLLAPDDGSEETVLDVGSLAPEEADEEPVVDLAMLAPDAADDEPVMDLASLAPDATDDEPVIDLPLLAPDADEETVLDVASLAPEPADDEPVMELAMLAPDATDDEPVMDLATLAPDADEEAVLDVASLAPETTDDEPVMELATLAPDATDDEPVMDLATLAPDDVEEETVLEVESLAPDDVEEETVLEVESLAPEAEPEEPVLELSPLALDVDEERAVGLDALAPSVDLRATSTEASGVAGTGGSENGHMSEDEAVSAGFAAPDESEEIVVDLDALRAEHTAVSSGPPRSGPLEVEIAAEGDMEADDRPFAAQPSSEPDADTDVPADDHGEPIFTRTLAELYAAQGAVKEAITVMKHLLEENPQDAGLARRIAELETGGPSSRGRAEEAESARDEQEDHEVETLARDLAESGRRPKDVQSPFGWTEREPAAEPEGPTMREYFDGLLGWEPSDS